MIGVSLVFGVVCGLYRILLSTNSRGFWGFGLGGVVVVDELTPKAVFVRALHTIIAHGAEHKLLLQCLNGAVWRAILESEVSEVSLLWYPEYEHKTSDKKNQFARGMD